ncbi:MAG: hypothetical protein MUF05_06770 [Candidatus Omnitrophica bacterium]|jgi:hypothetical protein|nr:hypothetical protein [Candidatus Omnitrophota bacterium]
MSSIFIAGLILLTAYFQAGIINDMRLLYLKPDLLFLINALFSLLFCYNIARVLIIGLFCGLAKDIFISGSVGLNCILFPVFSLLFSFVARKIEIENIFVKISVVAAGFLFYSLIIHGLMLTNGLSVSWGVFLRILAVGVIFSAAGSYILWEYIINPSIK